MHKVLDTPSFMLHFTTCQLVAYSSSYIYYSRAALSQNTAKCWRCWSAGRSWLAADDVARTAATLVKGTRHPQLHAALYHLSVGGL